MTTIEGRYAHDHQVFELQAEGWAVSAFLGWRGGFPTFLLTRDVPGTELDQTLSAVPPCGVRHEEGWNERPSKGCGLTSIRGALRQSRRSWGLDVDHRTTSPGRQPAVRWSWRQQRT